MSKSEIFVLIAVIKYDREASGLLKNSFKRMGVPGEFKFTDCEDEICSAEKIILPDTSNIRLTLRWMQFRNFYNLFRMIHKPVLGIAAGAAMMCESISDITGLCLGLFPVSVDCSRMNDDDCIAQAGLEIVSDSKLLTEITMGESYHFDNKCKIGINDFTSSKMLSNGKEFTATIEKSNYYGVMFNPAKSGEEGMKVIKNFVML